MSGMIGKHCHAQIEYEKFDGSVESLVGFDPHRGEHRKMLHKMLDEFLDQCLVPKFDRTELMEKANRDRFIVFGSVDTH